MRQALNSCLSCSSRFCVQISSFCTQSVFVQSLCDQSKIETSSTKFERLQVMVLSSINEALRISVWINICTLQSSTICQTQIQIVRNAALLQCSWANTSLVFTGTFCNLKRIQLYLSNSYQENITCTLKKDSGI